MRTRTYSGQVAALNNTHAYSKIAPPSGESPFYVQHLQGDLTVNLGLLEAKQGPREQALK